MQPAQQQAFTIGEAARLLGISSETLRRYDRAGKIIVRRTPGGKRFFTKEDVEQIRIYLKKKNGNLQTNYPQSYTTHKSFAFFTTFLILIIFVLLGISGFFFLNTPFPAKIASDAKSRASDLLVSLLEEKLGDLEQIKGKLSLGDREILGDKEALQASIGSLPLYSPTNLMINSSFEGGITSYSIIGQSTNSNTKVGNESVRSGTQGLRINDSSCINCQLGVSQPKTTTINGRSYVLSLYVRSSTPGVDGAKLRIGLFGTVSTSDPVYLAAKEKNELNSSYYTNYSSDRFEDFELGSISINEWVRLSSSFENLPLGKYPLIEVIDYLGGTVYIDDISLNEGVKWEAGRDLSLGGESQTSSSLPNSLLTSNPFFPHEINNSRLADNTVIADSFGNLYPSSPFVGTLGTKDYTFKSLYLDKLTINNGDISTSGKIEGKSITSSSTTTSTFAGDLSITGNIDITGVYKKDGTSGKTVSTCGSSQYLGGIAVTGGIITTLGSCTTVSSKWSGLTDPDANLSLSMGANTTTLTYNAATGTSNLFTLTDTASNTGTGYLLNLTTASSSTLLPFRVQARGNTIIDTTATGGVTIGNATSAQAVTIDAGTATLNLGNSNNAKTINIGTGTAIDTINIGTGATGVDVIQVGSSVASLALTDADWSITTGGVLSLSLGSATAPSYTFTGDTNNGIFSSGADTLNFTTAGSERVRIDSSGNVGIGTTGPGTKLEVFKTGNLGTDPTSATSHLLRLTNSESDVVDEAWGIAFNTDASGVAKNGAYIIAVGKFNTNFNTDLTFGTRPTVSGEPSERLRITSAGDVGIGDSTPAALLTVGSGDLFQVISTGEVRSIAGTAAAPTYAFTGDTNTGMYSAGGDIVGFTSGGTARVWIGPGIQVLSAAGAQPTGGDKGGGTINLVGDIFKNNTAYTNPDYAFEKFYTGSIVKFINNPGASDYPGLVPLLDVESYSKNNYQLPRVAQRSGIFDRGDIVLEKMEEAYLYLFNHEHRLVDLESSNKNLLTVVGLSDKTALSTSSGSLTTVSATVVASPSAQVNLNDLNHLSGSIFSRLDSLEKLVLTLSSLSVGGTGSASSLQASPSASFDNLTILKKLLTADLGITGKISSGLLSINGLDNSIASGSATINTLTNDLYLQNLGLGGLNILNGKVTIDTSGNLKVENTITASKIEVNEYVVSGNAIGQGTILAGQTQVEVVSQVSTPTSKIFVTPTTKTGNQSLIVSGTNSGKFIVSIETPQASDIIFNWWIIGAK